MMDKLLIPQYAKNTAKKAIKLRKKNGFSNTQTQRLGIISGVNQAKFLINNKYLSKKKALQYYKFYQRFKNCQTKKCKLAMNLWGGKKFLKSRVFKFIKNNEKRKR